jgi:choline-sulfatase
MGISHNGQIQKNFNMYEQAIRILMVYSNPELYPSPLETDALVSHADFVPTMASLLGTPKSKRAKWEGVDYSAIVLAPQKAKPPQDYVIFNFDDFQGGQSQVGVRDVELACGRGVATVSFAGLRCCLYRPHPIDSSGSQA